MGYLGFINLCSGHSDYQTIRCSLSIYLKFYILHLLPMVYYNLFISYSKALNLLFWLIVWRETYRLMKKNFIRRTSFFLNVLVYQTIYRKVFYFTFKLLLINSTKNKIKIYFLSIYFSPGSCWILVLNIFNVKSEHMSVYLDWFTLLIDWAVFTLFTLFLCFFVFIQGGKKTIFFLLLF